jgi:predicted  nucleic acid-binding Zn-ribbon protein
MKDSAMMAKEYKTKYDTLVAEYTKEKEGAKEVNKKTSEHLTKLLGETETLRVKLADVSEKYEALKLQKEEFQNQIKTLVNQLSSAEEEVKKKTSEITSLKGLTKNFTFYKFKILIPKHAKLMKHYETH